MPVKKLTPNQSIFRWLYYFPSRCVGKLIKSYINRRYPGLDLDAEVDKQTGLLFDYLAKPVFLEIVRRTPFQNNEIHFLDAGCGKGNVLVFARKCRFAQVAGVELSDKFFTVCESNMRILGLDDVILFHRDATLLESELDAFNVIYMYNPFPEEVLRKFLLCLKESVTRKPRRICVAYANPVYATVLIEMGFRETQRFEMETYYYLNTAALYEL